MKMLVLALIAGSALAQTPQHMLFKQPNLPRSSLAFFEFAPASGAGMPAACSTTAPTGAKGEAVTTTRATAATCQSTAAGGMVSSGISNGELSSLSSGVPRVEFDRNGVKGFRVESSRTERSRQSEALNNAAWLGFSVTVAAPTITANQSTAPDGTLTADRMQIPAVTTAEASFLYQGGPASTAVPSVGTFFVRGNSTSGTFDVCHQGGGSYVCSDCAYVSGSWTRCSRITASPAGSQLTIGNMGSSNSVPTARGAADVFVWGGEGRYGSGVTFPLSYGATTSADVVFDPDVISLPVTLSGSQFSAAISYDAPAVLVSGATAFQIYVDANNSVTAALNGSSQIVCTFRIGGVDSTVTSAATLTPSAVNRVSCQYGATGRSACVGSSCTTTAGALTMPTGAATFYVGTRQATGNESNGVMSRGCYDPAALRCFL